MPRASSNGGGRTLRRCKAQLERARALDNARCVHCDFLLRSRCRIWRLIESTKTILRQARLVPKDNSGEQLASIIANFAISSEWHCWKWRAAERVGERKYDRPALVGCPVDFNACQGYIIDSRTG